MPHLSTDQNADVHGCHLAEPVPGHALNMYSKKNYSCLSLLIKRKETISTARGYLQALGYAGRASQKQSKQPVVRKSGIQFFASSIWKDPRTCHLGRYKKLFLGVNNPGHRPFPIVSVLLLSQYRSGDSRKEYNRIPARYLRQQQHRISRLF